MKRLLGLLVFLNCSISAGPIITFYFNEYPCYGNTKAHAEQISHELSQPHGIAHHTLEGLTCHCPVAGIVSTYFGFLQVSNANGQTTFPRKRSSPHFMVVVTNKITPAVMFANTISHWEVEQNNPVQVYDFNLIKDPETQLLYWKVKKAEAPKDNHISTVDSIVIVAKPTAFYVPEGITLAKEDANLILPDMYIKTGIHPNRNALYMLNLSHYYRPVDMLYKKEGKTVDILTEEY